MYLGNQPALNYTSFAKQDFTTSATTSYTLDNPVANANELALFINNVRQEPTTAYSASSTTLTLTEPTSSSDNMYCVYLGKAVQTVNPPNSSVGTSQLADNSVTKAKTSNLMYPSFEAYLSADQTGLTDATDVKLQADTEVFDTDSCYDNSTNYRFTPNVAGKYFVYSNIIGSATSSNDTVWTNNQIFKNGSIFKLVRTRPSGGNNANELVVHVSAIVDMNGTTDYLEIYGNVNTASNGTWYFRELGESNYFGAYRIGD